MIKMSGKRAYIYERLKDGSILWTEKIGRVTIRKGRLGALEDNPMPELTWEDVYNIFDHKKIKITVLEE